MSISESVVKNQSVIISGTRGRVSVGVPKSWVSEAEVPKSQTREARRPLGPNQPVL